jgi:hypothetical protein
VVRSFSEGNGDLPVTGMGRREDDDSWLLKTPFSGLTTLHSTSAIRRAGVDGYGLTS